MEHQLQKLGRLIHQAKIAFVVLSILNVAFLLFEDCVLSEKMITVAWSGVLMISIKSLNNSMKDILILLMLLLLSLNLFLLMFDIEFFIRQSFGSLIEFITIAFFFKRVIREEGKLQTLESRVYP
ncbi:hypothetical protein KMW28_15435 [Flammeovirga yaeyamensis]|uniref:Uncharacterized protein n=1 Tax=Flammeovirga yaeyamensis TaxID=367791 RepID=A0AAX1N0M1_9BACT|nr:hypothetical protein [Flammeovirga yaeyamensis]MBB3698596.1 hypothetical protein [Flammeovirga yaeyamensis]NMF34056.1 hypothetical protein [Flammeovirga yaeyamensis]QWG01044.1 hypothetical protein KMW28_15435 [Flammeovirga yaeyamensis]